MAETNLMTKVEIQIQKPAAEVYEAIVDPDKMTKYFISESSGRMEDDTKLKWGFSEFPDRFWVHVKKAEPNIYVSFIWEVEGDDHLVEMTLDDVGEGDTKVTITEKNKVKGEMSVDWVKGSTSGWTNFLACLKAYIEYGINLRKGAYEFMKG